MKNEKECYDLIFPRNREGHSTEVKSLSEIRKVMPTIIVGDDFAGVSPMVAPDQELLEKLTNERSPHEKR